MKRFADRRIFGPFIQLGRDNTIDTDVLRQNLEAIGVDNVQITVFEKSERITADFALSSKESFTLTHFRPSNYVVTDDGFSQMVVRSPMIPELNTGFMSDSLTQERKEIQDKIPDEPIDLLNNLSRQMIQSAGLEPVEQTRSATSPHEMEELSMLDKNPNFFVSSANTTELKRSNNFNIPEYVKRNDDFWFSHIMINSGHIGNSIDNSLDVLEDIVRAYYTADKF